MRHSFLLFVSLALVSAAGRAQLPIRQAIDSGAAVRLHWAGGQIETVRLTARLAPPADSVHLCRYPAPTCGGSINPQEVRPTAALVRIDRRRGNRAGHGAAVGALIGAAMSAVAFVSAAAVGEGPPISPYGVLISGAMTGAGFGALIGSFSDRWEPAP